MINLCLKCTWNSSDLLMLLAISLLKTKKELENLWRLETQTCFQHDMAYGEWKDLARRTQSGKVLKHKAFKILSNPKYDGYKRGLASMVYKFFDKTSAGSGVATLANESMPNYQLANEVHRQIIRKFKRRKVYSSFKDNIWGLDSADMQSLSKWNKIIKCLLFAVDLFSKYT